MSDISFVLLPLISLFCSLFLFLAVASAAKNRQIWALLLLLGSFVLWTGGSLFMRLGAFPGMMFWYQVSALGIFCVPFLIYNFIHSYTGRKGNFTRFVLLALWAVIVGLNIAGVFITDPHIGLENGVQTFAYGLTLTAVIPVALAGLTILAAVLDAVRSIRRDGMPPSMFYPLLLGVAVMFFGLLVQAFFGIEGLSTDTLFCAVNSVCLYYALYKKRVLTLTPISSRAPSYLTAVVFSTLLCTALAGRIDEWLARLLGHYAGSRTVAFALVFSVFTLLIYAILHRMMEKLFVRGQEAREQELKRFSSDVSKSLRLADVVEVYREFLSSNGAAETAYIMTAGDGGDFYVSACTRDLGPRTFVLSAASPLAAWLLSDGRTAFYRDFCRTSGYKAMWEREKDEIARLGVQLVIPVVCDSSLVGLTLFTGKDKNRRFTPSEISFLESASAILAIAFKNASLYAKMENEARRDALTGLYNRGCFLRLIDEDFKKARADKLALVMLSLDDFRLYNELYGSAEGDSALKAFARILTAVAGERGTAARYAGKEFMLSLPFTDPRTADSLTQQCRELFAREMASRGADRRLTFSAGVCGYPTSASSVEELISFAGMAVYSAKSSGKNMTVVYALGAAGGSLADDGAARKRDLAESCSPMIFALTAAIDAKDHYTFKHSNNVSRYASTLAEAIALDAEHVEIIRQAGLLHDIGKIGIPESILSKTARLTDDEYSVMKSHVDGSIDMIRHLPSLDYVIPAAVGHHERWDGRGYPRGIAGETIPIGARCLCLADTFDAMTTQRPYREALSIDTALGEIERGLGTQFDPRLGRTFITLVRTGVIRVEK